ncbi:MAG TPA: hypothetical protein PLS84_08310 [Salinivirgaceae bacterium]|nr:hypothetical protein [Salinivirgaceae bacterium]
MRDPRRIKRICEKLCIIWESMPDQRFGQLLENEIRFNQLFPFDYRESQLVPFLWGQEDDKTEEILDRIIAELNSKNK